MNLACIMRRKTCIELFPVSLKYFSHHVWKILKGYGQSHVQPVSFFFVQAKLVTGIGSCKEGSNWWCKVIIYCQGVNLCRKSTKFDVWLRNKLWWLRQFEMWKNWRWTTRSHCKAAPNKNSIENLLTFVCNFYPHSRRSLRRRQSNRRYSQSAQRLPKACSDIPLFVFPFLIGLRAIWLDNSCESDHATIT